MKKYLIHYDFITSEYVEAENEEEALEKSQLERTYDNLELYEKIVVEECEIDNTKNTKQ